jgi:hypothetical protein
MSGAHDETGFAAFQDHIIPAFEALQFCCQEPDRVAQCFLETGENGLELTNVKSGATGRVIFDTASAEKSSVDARAQGGVYVTLVTDTQFALVMSVRTNNEGGSIVKRNVGAVDKVARIIVGVGLLSLIFVLQDNLRWLGLVGIVPLATGLIGYCPLYSLFGLSTCPTKTRLHA